jgi:hypothetical protein
MYSDGRVESEGEGLGSASPERGQKTREADVPGDSPSEDVEEELEEGPNDKVLARTFPSGRLLVFPHTSALLARFLLPFLPDALCAALFVGWFFEDSLGEVSTVTMYKANTWTSPGAGVPVYSASFPPLNLSFFSQACFRDIHVPAAAPPSRPFGLLFTALLVTFSIFAAGLLMQATYRRMPTCVAFSSAARAVCFTECEKLVHSACRHGNMLALSAGSVWDEVVNRAATILLPLPPQPGTEMYWDVRFRR